MASLPQRPAARRPSPRPVPGRATSRRRGDRGVAYPSPVVLLSVVAVAMAAVAFVATRDAAPTEREITTVAQDESPSASADASSAPPVESPKPEIKKKKKVVKRGDTYVVVFNNSGITGLAGSVASKASGAGWQVVGADNWYGTIPTTTVYYPPKFKAAAKLLALDLGIERIQPAIEPMNFDRLTVILTADAA